MDVLLIENEPSKIVTLQAYCRSAEIDAEVMRPQALDPAPVARAGWDIIVLDLDTRFIPVFQLLDQMRTAAFGLTPLLCHSAVPDPEHEIEIRSLRAGADFCFAWPVSEPLFLARLEVLKRARDLMCLARQEKFAALSFYEIELDRDNWQCRVHGEPVDLTVTEFKLLETLMRQPHVVFSRDHLIDALFGKNIFVEDRTVDSHVKRLRKKLQAAGAGDYIETLYGVGYSLRQR